LQVASAVKAQKNPTQFTVPKKQILRCSGTLPGHCYKAEVIKRAMLGKKLGSGKKIKNSLAEKGMPIEARGQGARINNDPH